MIKTWIAKHMMNSHTAWFQKCLTKFLETNKTPQKWWDFRAFKWVNKLALKSCSHGNFGHLMPFLQLCRLLTRFFVFLFC